jgi:hypothetical protein
MRIVTNTSLAKRNRQIAQYISLFSFGVLLLGLFINFQLLSSEDVLLNSVIPSAILIIAMISTFISVRMNNQWARQPRPENVLPEALKGISTKSVLYNYHHNPARHVLIAPQGVFAITIRWQDGNFAVNGDRWRAQRSALNRLAGAFRFDSLGEPTIDAQRHAQRVAELLSPIAADVPVQPLIVFTGARVNLTIENPTIPVLYASTKLEPNLKSYMKDLAKTPQKTLTEAQIEAFEAATVQAAK